MLIIVAMVLAGISVLCVGITARQCATDDIAPGPPVLALLAAFASVALMLTATAYGH
ncbi:hypothetical protein ACIRF8_19055 [Streptomyces sp. NPDC102406]|uniref:hypothetical protein n=1 Tax=Streptomyces sp. NPDC102406 TaxID=3366171 RepID=UPI0037F857F8